MAIISVRRVGVHDNTPLRPTWLTISNNHAVQFHCYLDGSSDTSTITLALIMISLQSPCMQNHQR